MDDDSMNRAWTKTTLYYYTG